MSDWLGLWTGVNTCVVMFALGLANRSTADTGMWLRLRAIFGHNLLLPLAVWGLSASLGWLSPGVELGWLLCILAAGGTSGGAFVVAARGSASEAATLIVSLVGTSLAGVLLLATLQPHLFQAFSGWGLALNLGSLTLLPLLAGQLLRQQAPVWADWLKSGAERLGGIMIAALVVFLAVRYAPAILAGPKEPFGAALALVLILILAVSLEPSSHWRRTLLPVSLIRNMSLALWLASRLAIPAAVLPTLLAYGLLMYLGAGLMLWKWRGLSKRHPV